MRLLPAIVALVGLVAALPARAQPAATAAAGASPSTQPVFTRSADGAGPSVEGNVIHLLTGTVDKEVNSFALPASSDRPVLSFEMAMTLRMDAASEGLGILLLDADVVGHESGLQFVDQWEEPSRENAIGIGLDAKNPPTDDPYDANGNIRDRPQREASVHVNGREIFNKQSADFATGKDVAVLVRLTFVPGGAKLTLRIGDEKNPTYNEQLLPGVRPFTPRVAIGSRTAAKSKIDVANLVITPGAPAGNRVGDPVRMMLFDRVVVNAKNREPRAIVTLDKIPGEVGRVIATLTIAAPPGGFDKRDCRGALYIHAADGQRFEVFRFKTAFSKPWEWMIDVTDLLPLMQQGMQQTFGIYIDTWREGGFETTVTLDFYPGKPERHPIAVQNLWIGEPILGDPRMPVASFFDTKTVIVPKDATGARARITVTGHGRVVNGSSRDAEFRALWRELIVNEETFPKERGKDGGLLWTTDNYLNPCRPQRDAWKEDRAGWGPGRIVEPWLVDLSPLLKTSRELTMDYRIEPYTNNHVGKGDPPTHWVDGQVIFYAD